MLGRHQAREHLHAARFDHEIVKTAAEPAATIFDDAQPPPLRPVIGRQFLQPDFGFEGASGLDLHLGEQNGAAKRRVAGKGHLTAREEDAHPGGIARIFGLHYEDRFREIEFARDRLHLLRAQSIGIVDDGKRIAAEAPVGEDIKGVEFEFHGGDW